MGYPVVLYKTSDAEREEEREGQVPSPQEPCVCLSEESPLHWEKSQEQDSLQMLHGM